MPLRLAVTATVALTTPVPAADSATAVAAPVLDRALFNVPLGTAAEQNAIFIRVAGLVDRVPAGEQAAMSFFGFGRTPGPDANARCPPGDLRTGRPESRSLFNVGA